MPVNTTLANEQFTRFVYMRDQGHLKFLTKAGKCENFVAGNQWAQEDLDALRAQKRPALTINKILSTLSTILGEQVNNRSETLFRPAAGASPEIAEALTKVFQQISQNNQLPWVRSEWFADGLIRSRGFIDARLDFTDSMQGEVRITNVNSKNVLIDPDADQYDPDAWMDVFTSKWMTPQDITTLYSEEDAEILKNREGSAFTFGADSLERSRDRFGGVLITAGNYDNREPHGVNRNIRVLDRQYRRLDKQLHFVDVKTGDMRAVPTSWDRNKIASVIEKAQGQLSTTKKLIKRVRWCVTADDVVLHDDWSPYKHFTLIPYFPLFRYGDTIGIVENLLGSQELLNKTSSQELHVINTSANSGWKIKTGALKNMSIEELEQSGATTGLVLELDDVKGAEKILPNATPQGLDRVSYKAEEHIKTISGVSDSQQGFDREDVAAKAIQYKQQAGATARSKMLDSLERSDWLLARNVLDLVQEYYTEERLVSVLHSDLLREPETITVNQMDPATGEITNDLTLGEYDIVITSTPFRATLEDSQFEQAMAMRERGIQIPDDYIVENSRLTRKADLVKRLQGDSESPEAQKAAALKDRMEEATVVKLEAEAMAQQAAAKLSAAKAERELALIGVDQAKVQIDAQAAASAPGADPGVEQAAAQQEMDLQVDKHNHEKDLAERKFELEKDKHEHTKQLATEKQQFQEETDRASAFAKQDTTKGE